MEEVSRIQNASHYFQMHWETIQLTQLPANIYHVVKNEGFLENKQHSTKCFRQRNSAATITINLLTLLSVFLRFSLSNYSGGSTVPSFLLASANGTL